MVDSVMLVFMLIITVLCITPERPNTSTRGVVDIAIKASLIGLITLMFTKVLGIGVLEATTLAVALGMIDTLLFPIEVYKRDPVRGRPFGTVLAVCIMLLLAKSLVP